MLYLPALSPFARPMYLLKSVPASMALVLGIALVPNSAIAQPLFVAQQILPQDTTPEFDPDPLPEPDLTPLPSVEELLQSPEPSSTPELGDESELRVTVNRIEFKGHTIFSDEELAAVIPEGIIGESVTINRLYEIRSAVAQKYIDAGYASSGAFLPEQPIQDGVITIQIVEGSLTTIDIRGNEKLKDSYIANRIWRDIETPLNVEDLLDTLRRLQLDPRIATLSAELSGGVALGEGILTVDVVEGDDLNVVLGLDNSRSPSVGSFRQFLDLNLLNFNGYGETFNLGLARTSGSTALDGSISTFLGADNSTLQLRGGISKSEIIEDPFEILNLESDSFFAELAYRQPLFQTLTEELALGVSVGHQQTRSVFDLSNDFGGPIPLTRFGANEDGEIRVSTLRLFQEWNKRRARDVFAARSQFSIGLDALNSTVNTDGRPDSRFVAWRGQAQWARLLEEDTLLLVQTDLQFADDDLLSLEQFGLGGQRTVRGYRQDLLLTDNGVLASAEVRFPIIKARKVDGVLHLIPFLDVGKGWNISDEDPDPSTIVGTGFGLQWQQNDLTARIDIGLPLVDVDTRDDDSLQEMGIYMSLEWEAF
ncbi:MAG: ShlB/FhaC/HecB family hemolysin secretion/activation protein [Cyanobacteria bacterium P01_F01_bin.150]